MSFPEWDKDLFVYLNSKNVPWLDGVMMILSSYSAWAVVCLAVVLFLVFHERVRGKVAALFMVAGIGFTLLLNNVVKVLIMRPRPGNEELMKGLINQLEEVGTSYSFFSAHSSSSFCLALFSALYFKNKVYSILIFIWAITVAYSRIYVGKHYPLDVIVGILFGLFTGWLAFRWYQRYSGKRYPTI